MSRGRALGRGQSVSRDTRGGRSRWAVRVGQSWGLGALGGPEGGVMAWGHPGIRVPKRMGQWGRMSCVGVQGHEWAS